MVKVILLLPIMLISIMEILWTFTFFNIFMLSILDLTPNCDNTRDLHPSLRGNVNLEVTFKEATQTTITVLMYTASSGGISVGKDFDVQMLSSDY